MTNAFRLRRPNGVLAGPLRQGKLSDREAVHVVEGLHLVLRWDRLPDDWLIQLGLGLVGQLVLLDGGRSGLPLCIKEAVPTTPSVLVAKEHVPSRLLFGREGPLRRTCHFDGYSSRIRASMPATSRLANSSVNNQS